jgi:hypothetical protein
MNNSQGSFIHTTIKLNQHPKSRLTVREFFFDDIAAKGTFLFTGMKLELFPDGKWCFYINAEGKSTTTVLKNGRKSGPNMLVAFKDKDGVLMEEISLGQVNYGCKDADFNSYVCKGSVKFPEAVHSVSVRYEAFVDFACRNSN